MVAILISWNIEMRPKEYFVWLLVLETSLLGVFTSLDFLLFFIFWEIELVPMYFLISIWGSRPQDVLGLEVRVLHVLRQRFMLVGILVTAFAGQHLRHARRWPAQASSDAAPADAGALLLPDHRLRHQAAGLPLPHLAARRPHRRPDGGERDAGRRAAEDGRLRDAARHLHHPARRGSRRQRSWLAPSPSSTSSTARMVTMVQTDLKRLIAYSSISHMGYVLLGISALGTVGLTGAGMQMFTHGVITGLLFVLVGLVYDRTHTRQISELSGLAHQMPFIAVVMVIAGLASLGLPTLAGFVSEVTVFLGTFGKYGRPDGDGRHRHPADGRLHPVDDPAGVLRASATLVGRTWVMLRAWWERAALVAMVGVILLVGIYPAVVADVIEKGVQPIAAGLA